MSIDFIKFSQSHGLIISRLVQGKIVRCPTSSKPRHKNGSYMFMGSWGWVMDWLHHDEPIFFKSDNITDDQMQVKIKQHAKDNEEEKRRLSDQAASKAKQILSECELELSVYLARKGFPEMSANILKTEEDHVLIIPMYRDKKLSGCQRIWPDGSKRFLFGQQSKGAYFRIGSGKRLFYIEGYASGLSLQVLLGKLKVDYSIIVCFSASNLTNLAKGTNGFVIADHDTHGKGQQAAEKSGCRWWMPPNPGQDINDHWLDVGTFKASQELKKAITTERSNNVYS